MEGRQREGLDGQSAVRRSIHQFHALILVRQTGRVGAVGLGLEGEGKRDMVVVLLGEG